MGAPGAGAVRVVARCARLAGTDRLMAFGLVFGIAALAWFAVGPAGGQRVGLAVVAPVYAGLIGVGQLRVGVDPRLRPAARRFWRVLSASMFTYTAGMLVNLTALVFGIHVARDAGETLFYPVAAVFTVVALVVFPTAVRSAGERLRMLLDVATVLLGSATFVWYFLVSRRWRPANGWAELADGVVLPGLILVVGFVILRIMMAGANVISRPTAAGFVFGASCIAVPVILDAEAGTAADRVGALVHLTGFLSCLVAIAIQRRVGLAGDGRPAAWRRSFTVLPYGAVAATLSLLLWVVKPHLDYRSWFVAIGALALCAAVVARQVASLWETSRLLKTNRELTGRLHHQAYHDELTGLDNRALFTEHVAKAVAQTRLDGSTAALLFVDLDDFKFVNDSLGHQIGDQLLAAVAARLRTTVPTRGFLGRLGGDEFALLTVAGGDGAGHPARAVAEEVIAALREPFVVSGRSVDVQASIGIATATGGRRASLNCCATPTSPCTRPSTNTRVAGGSSNRRCSPRSCAVTGCAPRWPTRWPAASSPSSTSRSSTCWPAQCTAPRRWCAGGARARRSPRRATSSRWRRRPALSSRSTASSSTPPAARRPDGPSIPLAGGRCRCMSTFPPAICTGPTSWTTWRGHCATAACAPTGSPLRSPRAASATTMRGPSTGSASWSASAFTWPSTTSVPATPRWPTCGGCRSTC